MSIIILICGILLLLFLITVLQFNAFIALIITSLFVGLGVGMDYSTVLKSLQKGIGDTLGPLAMVLGFGVMLGKILSETGAIQRISSGMIHFFGVQRIKLALVITGFIVGIAMFYNAGFVVLIPLVFFYLCTKQLAAGICGDTYGFITFCNAWFFCPHTQVQPL